MSLPITSIRPPAGIEPVDLQGGKSQGAAGAFQSALTDAIGSLQQTQNTSEATVGRFLSGENEEVHQIAIQTQQTEVAFDMFMAVRNKVVQAYQEVMKMQM